MSLPFLFSALRAIVELQGLCLLAQGALFLLAGEGRGRNPIYAGFALVTGFPRRLTRRMLPGSPAPATVAALTFLWLFALWVGLAWWRKSL